VEPEVRRIAVVTRSFPGLLGLQSVALGMWLLVLLLQRQLPLLGWLQGYGVLSSSFLVTIVLIRAYYTKRFGRIERREENRFWWILWLGITVALVDTATYARGVPSAFFFTIAGFSVGTVIRDWPFRAHRLALAAAALVASLAFAGVTDEETRRTWTRQTLLTIAVALIVAGVGDHRLLTTTLAGSKAEADAIEVPIR
jgi:hypothetical protein